MDCAGETADENETFADRMLIDSIRTALFGVAIFALALAIAFGGLAAWPLYRRAKPTHAKRLRWLKVIFVAHIGGAVAALVYIAMANINKYPDAYMSLTLLYIVGLLSIVASGLVVGLGSVAVRLNK